MFCFPSCRCSAPSALIWVLVHVSDVPVLIGCKNYWWLVPWPVAVRSRFQVDLGSGLGWVCDCPMAYPGGLFASHFNYHLSPFPSHRTPGCGKGCFLQSWDGHQAYALPTFSLFRQVLHSLMNGVVSCSFGPLIGFSCRPSVQDHLPWQPHFHLLHQDLRVLCLLAWRPFCVLLDICGLSWGVACQLAVSCHSSSHCPGQHEWVCLGVGAPVRVIQCWTLRSPGLQVSVLSFP